VLKKLKKKKKQSAKPINNKPGSCGPESQPLSSSHALVFSIHPLLFNALTTLAMLLH